MDEWLAAVEKDTRDVPLAQKIIEDKPRVARATAARRRRAATCPPSVCDATVQSYSDPRIEAGMPLDRRHDQVRAQAAAQSHYLPLQFTDAEREALQGAFPTGVCDYSKPGVDRVPTVPWLTYKDGPGGEPLGEVPKSVPAAGALAAAPGGSLVDVRVKAPRLASDSLRGRRIRLRIRGKKGLAAISHFVLQYRRTGRGTRKAYTTLRARLAKSTTRVRFKRGKIGETYLFRITAIGASGKRSAFHHSRTVFPYDDRGKGRRYSRGWRRVKSKRAWLGGYSRTSRPGAALNLPKNRNAAAAST